MNGRARVRYVCMYMLCVLSCYASVCFVFSSYRKRREKKLGRRTGRRANSRDLTFPRALRLEKQTSSRENVLAYPMENWRNSAAIEITRNIRFNVALHAAYIFACRKRQRDKRDQIEDKLGLEESRGLDNYL